MTSVTIELSDSLFKSLQKRAKLEMISVSELVIDIVRRSMLSYKGVPTEDTKIDDALVSVFSRKKTAKDKKAKKKRIVNNKPFYTSEFK
jgi:hypothetical protein